MKKIMIMSVAAGFVGVGFAGFFATALASRLPETLFFVFVAGASFAFLAAYGPREN